MILNDVITKSILHISSVLKFLCDVIHEKISIEGGKDKIKYLPETIASPYKKKVVTDCRCLYASTEFWIEIQNKDLKNDKVNFLKWILKFRDILPGNKLDKPQRVLVYVFCFISGIGNSTTER